MFERFHENARRAVLVARNEAQQSGSNHIGSEHLLLGIVREDSTLVARLSLREDAIRSRMQTNAGAPVEHDLPMSVAAKQALARGAQEADRLGQQVIAPIHLLMGLLQDEESLAYELLKSHGVTLAQVEALALPAPAH